MISQTSSGLKLSYSDMCCLTQQQIPIVYLYFFLTKTEYFWQVFFFSAAPVVFSAFHV